MTIIDNGGHCNAIHIDVTRMATLFQTRANSNYVLTFHNDAYSIDMFLVYKIKAYAKIKHWESKYLISNWSSGVETKYSGICFLPDKKTLRIHGGGITGSDDAFDFRA